MATKPIGSRGRGVTSEEVRRHNLALVLDRLHRSGAASRSSLTAATGLNRSTVGDLVGHLSALGLVEERDPEIDGPGRPSPVVVPLPASAVALACAINVYSLEVATVGLGGHVFERLVEPSPAGKQPPGDVVDRIVAMAHTATAALPRGARVIGSGVSVTAVVQRDDGVVRLAPNLGWVDVPLGAELQGRLDLPVTLANDADAGVLAEHVRGIAGGTAHVVYVSGEVGIGTGVIAAGIPFGGASGYAGEAGHMVVNPGGRTCGCGARGCWETEAGEEALLRATGTPVETDGLAALEGLRARAAAGETRALRGVAEVGHWLGVGIGDLVNLFNPELVLLGGFFNTFEPWLREAMLTGIRSRALDAPLAGARILPGALGPDAPLLGAAEIALRSILADPAALAT
jgi:predicted NBD/HSP70 family sugar kinase